MSRRILFIYFVVFTIGLFHYGSPVISQTQPPNLVIRPFTDLTLEIISPTTNCLSLQPIPIIINLRNTTNQAALGYNSMGFGGFPVSVFVKRVGSANRVRIRKLSPVSGLAGVIHSVIRPGESSIGKEWITLGLSEYFPTPGAYDIQLRLFNNNSTQAIDSNTIRVEIHEPTGMDRIAHDLIENSTFRDYLFSGAEFSEVRSTLEQLTTLYPNSAYARSASFVLGENYFYSRNHPQALANLVRLENDNNFIFADKVRRYLAEIRRLNSIQPGNVEP